MIVGRREFVGGLAGLISLGYFIASIGPIGQAIAIEPKKPEEATIDDIIKEFHLIIKGNGDKNTEHQLNFDHLDYFFSNYSKRVEETYDMMSLKSQGISLDLVFGIIAQESKFDSSERSSSNAFGLMQTKKEAIVEITKVIFSKDQHYQKIRNELSKNSSYGNMLAVICGALEKVNLNDYFSNVISNIGYNIKKAYKEGSSISRDLSEKLVMIKSQLKNKGGNCEKLFYLYGQLFEIYNSKKYDKMRTNLSNIFDDAINTPLFGILKTDENLQLAYGMAYLSYLKQLIDNDASTKNSRYKEQLLLAKYNGGPNTIPGQPSPQTKDYIDRILGKNGHKQKHKETESNIARIAEKYRLDKDKLEQFYKGHRFNVMVRFSPYFAGKASEEEGYKGKIAGYQASLEGSKFVQFTQKDMRELFEGNALTVNVENEKSVVDLNKRMFYFFPTNGNDHISISNGEFLYLPINK